MDILLSILQRLESLVMMINICASTMLNDPNFANIDLLGGRINSCIIRNTSNIPHNSYFQNYIYVITFPAMGNFTSMKSRYSSENKTKINNIEHLFPAFYAKKHLYLQLRQYFHYKLLLSSTFTGLEKNCPRG